MSKHQILINLSLRTDVNNEEYMIGSTDFPGSVDLRDATFIVFYPTEGEEHGSLIIRPRTLVPRGLSTSSDRD